MAPSARPSKRFKLTPREPSSSPPPDEDEIDSEADEWEQERRAGPSRQQFEQEEDGEEEEEEESEEEDGVGQYLEDEGEVIDSDDEETAIGKQLSAIPFGSLLKATKKLNASAAKKRQQQQDDSDSDDEQPDTMAGASRTMGGRAERKKQSVRPNGSLRKVDRASKHAPMEMSSKRAVARNRQIVETTANKARDPRFDSLSGGFKADLFKTGYSFLSQQQTAELEQMKKTAIAARKNHLLPQEEKDNIEAALTRMQSREVSRKTKEREGDALKQWKKDEAEKRKEGKKEFYLKKSDQKAVLLKAKFDVLAQDKKALRKTVEKHRRKTANKDKKLLPNRRP